MTTPLDVAKARALAARVALAPEGSESPDARTLATALLALTEQEPSLATLEADAHRLAAHAPAGLSAGLAIGGLLEIVETLLRRTRAAEATRAHHDGHMAPCYYCGLPCNAAAGNPGLWPVGLCHPEAPGVLRWHHTGCVSRRLHDRSPT